jgi:chromosome segregation ATPase
MFALTEAKVIEAAEKLAKAGENPTQVTVRDALGGGSFGTIGPALKKWKDAQKEEHAFVAVQIPDAVNERYEAMKGVFWEAALSESERRLMAERDALKVAQEAAAAEVAEQLEIVRELESEAEEFKAKIEKLESIAKTLSADFEGVSLELKTQMTKARDDRQAASEAFTKEASRAEAAIARAERAETLHDTEKQQARADREAAAKQARVDLADQKTAHDTAIKTLNDEIEKTRSAAINAASKAEKLEREALAFAAEKKKLQSGFEAAQSEVSAVQERVDKLEEKAEKAIQEAAELRGELKAIKAASSPITNQEGAKK